MANTPNLTTASISEYLNSINLNASFKYRKELWNAHRTHITDDSGATSYGNVTYTGTSKQNTHFLNFLKQINFHDPNSQSTNSSNGKNLIPKDRLGPLMAEYVANAEGYPGAGVEGTMNDGNMINDYHLGYQQMSGKNWQTVSLYIQHFVEKEASKMNKDIYLAHWGEYKDKVFTAAYNDLINHRAGRTDCQEFPKIWGVDEQMFFHAVFLADGASKALNGNFTLEGWIVHNIYGKLTFARGTDWTKETLSRLLYPGDCTDTSGNKYYKYKNKQSCEDAGRCQIEVSPGIKNWVAAYDNKNDCNAAGGIWSPHKYTSTGNDKSYWNYLQASKAPGLPNDISTDEKFNTIFTTQLTREYALEALELWAQKLYLRSTTLQNLFPASVIPELFRRHSLNVEPTILKFAKQDYKVYTPSGPGNKQAQPVLMSSASPPQGTGPPQGNLTGSSITTVTSGVVPTPTSIPAAATQLHSDVLEHYKAVLLNPTHYRYGEGMEENGALFIGDILFAIPPVSMRFSETNQSTSIPTMRTDGHPILTHNNGIPRVDITLFFNGTKSINEQLRPLVSMYQRMPFTTIQSHTVSAAWVGRREIEDQSSPYAKDVKNRFQPIPCFLENLTFSTLPGFPNTVQAHLSLVRMNRSPYGVTGRMWKTWEEAELAAKERSIRTSRDCTIYSTHRDESIGKDTLYIMDSGQTSHKVDIFDDIGANPKLNPTASTKFPQESVPFKYAYRHILIDDGLADPAQYGLKTYVKGTDLFGNKKDLTTHWPSYRAEDNKRVYLTYKAPKKFSNPMRKFTERLNILNQNNQKIRSMSNQILTMDDAELMQFFKPVSEVSFYDLAWRLIDTISVVKEFNDFQDAINAAFGKLVNQVILDDAGQILPMFGPATDFGVCKDEANDLLMMQYSTQGICEGVGFKWVQDKFFTFRSVNDPTKVLPIPKLGASANDFVYVDSTGQIVDTFAEFGMFMDAILGNTGKCTDPTAVTKAQCDKISSAEWKEKPETEDERLSYLERVQRITEPLIENYITDPLETLGLNDIGSKWNYDTIAVELSWIEDMEDDVLSNGSRVNALAMYSDDIEHLLEENQHQERTLNVNSAHPYHYQFQSVIQSITYNYGNAVTPHFITGSNMPVYQHMGVSNPTATMVLRTRDERFLKILTDMREALQEVGQQMLAGNFELAGLGTVDITGNLMGHGSDRVIDKNILGQNANMGIAATDELSGFLLNSVGLSQTSIENLTMRSIEGQPGWWEVTIDFIGNNQNIRILEMMDEIGVTSIPADLFAYMEHFFPCHKIDLSFLRKYVSLHAKDTVKNDIKNYNEEIETWADQYTEVEDTPDEDKDIVQFEWAGDKYNRDDMLAQLKHAIKDYESKVNKLLSDSSGVLLDLLILGDSNVSVHVDGSGTIGFNITGKKWADIGDYNTGCYIKDKVRIYGNAGIFGGRSYIEYPGFLSGPMAPNTYDFFVLGYDMKKQPFGFPIDENLCRDGETLFKQTKYYFDSQGIHGDLAGFKKHEYNDNYWGKSGGCWDDYAGSGKNTNLGCNGGYFNTEWREKEKMTQQGLYYQILKPMLDHMNLNLDRMRVFDDNMAKDPEWAEAHPETWRISGALESYYKDYIKNVMYMLSSVAQGKSRSVLFDARSRVLFPGYSTDSDTIKTVNISDQTIIAQSMVLANQIRTVFYYLLHREDFREFIDTQLAPRNAALKELVEILQGDIIDIDATYADIDAKIIGYNDKAAWKTEIQKLIDQIKSTATFLDSSTAAVDTAYRDFIHELNATIGKNHPDLKLPTMLSEKTGHRYISPGFPFVDDDYDLDLIEFSKIADQLKLSTFAQLAAITSGDFELYYYEFENMLNDAGNDADDALSKIIVQSFDGTNPRDVKMALKHMPAALKEGTCSGMSGTAYETALAAGHGHAELKDACTKDNGTWNEKFTFKHLLNNFKETKKLKDRIEQARQSGDPSTLEDQEFLVPSKEKIMSLMSTTAMLDYSITVIYASKWLSQISNAVGGKCSGASYTTKESCEDNGGTWTPSAKSNSQLQSDLINIATNLQDELQTYNFNTDNLGSVFQDAILTPYASLPGGQGLEISSGDANKISELGLAIAEEVGKKRKAAASIATIHATGNWPAFLNYFGIGDVTSVKKSMELKNQFQQQIQNKQRSSMDRAFPAFKIFFIEDDQYSWQAFDDFYTYDAASEITIVESKHAASKTAVIKLSNVTNALTNEQLNLVNETSATMPGALMRLKVGTKIMILIGYGADYRQLRMKFKGAITEMKAGPILELTAQSWGAGLLNTVGSTQGVKYSATHSATSLGAAILDVIAQTPGLSGLGRWEMRDSSLNSQAKVDESALKSIYYARALNSMAGYLTDVIPVDTNIRDVIGGFRGEGLPTTGLAISEAYRSNNIIVKAMGNSLYDNIIVNDTNPSGYGFYNFVDRAVNKLKGLVKGIKSSKFEWVIGNQTCWDALHEIALFMGDYIITTLPYNEGNDIFQHPPRETLYFGPREGQYRAKTYVPRLSEENVMQNLSEQIKKLLDFNYCDTIDVLTGKPYTTKSACESNAGKWIEEMDYTGLTPLEIEDIKQKTSDLNQQILNIGKSMMSKLIDHTYKHHQSFKWGHMGPGLVRMQRHYLDYDYQHPDVHKTFGRLLWNRELLEQKNSASGDFLEGYVANLKMNKFEKTAEWVGRWDIVGGSGNQTRQDPYMTIVPIPRRCGRVIYPFIDNTWKAYRVLNPTAFTSLTSMSKGSAYYMPPLGVTREILLNDFTRQYDNPVNAGEYNYMNPGYNDAEMRIITDMQAGLIPENLDEYKWEYGNDVNYGIFDYSDSIQNNGAMNRKYWDQWENGADQGIFGWVFGQYSATFGGGINMIKGGDTGDSTSFMGKSSLGGSSWTGDYGAWAKIYRPYFKNIDDAILTDTKNFIMNYKEIQDELAQGDLLDHSLVFDVQNALLQGLGFLDAFAYKPVVNHHLANSYEDIIENSIVATSDQMYNHVEMLIPDDADDTNNPANATKRVQAWVSFDQDPDYLRTYQTYQKNVRTSLWYDKNAADVFYDEASAGVQSNHQGISKALGLDETVVAQSILMNAVRPMYQGNLVLLGNPNIKPWDIVHIHDDTLEMYGPIEVEQVVNTISVSGGYTTHIVPNLCVYYKSASRAVDNILLDFSSKINTLGFFWNIISHGATMYLARRTFGSRGFGKDFKASRFWGAPLYLINSYSSKGAKAAEHFKKLKMTDILKKKKIARKFLSKKEYKKIVKLAEEAKTKTKEVSRMTSALKKSAILTSPAGKAKNAAVTKILTQMDDILINSGGTLTSKNKKAYEALTKKLYVQLGGKAGDTVLDTKVLNKMAKFTQKYPVFGADMRSFANKLVPGIVDNPALRSGTAAIDDIAVRMLNLADEIDELTRLENQVINGRQKGQRGRPYTNSGRGSLKARRERIARLASGIVDDVSSPKTKRVIKKIAEKEFRSNWKSITSSVKTKFASRAAIGGLVLKALNVAGWIYTFYELGDMIWEMYAGQARAKIFLTGMLTCENQLVWVPLEYQGMEYTAGMEGIIGSPRGVSTVLMGEMSGDGSTTNRTMVVLDMLAKGAEDQMISSGSASTGGSSI